MSKTSFKDVVREVANQTGFCQKDVRVITDCFFAVISQAEAVTVPGFGTFKKKERPARDYINPLNGEKVSRPAKTVLAFKEAKRK